VDPKAWLAELKKYLGAWPSQAAHYFRETWGISPALAVKFATLYAALQICGLGPRINSGFRDPAKQRELIRRWNAGDRAGFIGKPADPDKSRHCKTDLTGAPASTAIDMPCNNIPLADSIARALGLRVGSDFNDPGHYDGG
jgi:hypothetical protein